MNIDKTKPIELSLPVAEIKARLIEAYRNTGITTPVEAVLKASVGTTVADLLDLPLASEGRGSRAEVRVSIHNIEETKRLIASERATATPQVKRMLTTLVTAINKGVAQQQSRFEMDALQHYGFDSGGLRLYLGTDHIFHCGSLDEMIMKLNRTIAYIETVRNSTFTLQNAYSFPLVINESGFRFGSVHTKWIDNANAIPTLHYSVSYAEVNEQSWGLAVPSEWVTESATNKPVGFSWRSQLDLEGMMNRYADIVENIQEALLNHIAATLENIKTQSGLEISIRNATPVVAIAS